MKKINARKLPQKRKQKTKSKIKKSNFKLFALSNILVFITTVLLIISGYLYIQNNDLQQVDIKKDNIVEKEKLQRAKYAKEKLAFEEKTKALEIEYVNNIDNTVYIERKPVKQKIVKLDLPKKQIKVDKKIDKEKLIVVKKKEIIIVKPKVLEKEKKPIVKKIVQERKKESIKRYLPKLAIIIDDVTTRKQMNKIINIGYSVNMAFLPPNKSRKNSAKIIKELKRYMIHLPLQATNHRYDEKDTLLITDDISVIERRIKSLQTLYPKAKFINNHTGSKFTANKEAMDRLLQVLKKYNYTFIDSRTTAKTVAKESAKKYGVRMLSRNIFLDNKKDKKYIQKQLKKAISIAKKNGSAIAIGHPYTITLTTLKESQHLLKGVELVYVNRL